MKEQFALARRVIEDEASEFKGYTQRLPVMVDLTRLALEIGLTERETEQIKAVESPKERVLKYPFILGGDLAELRPEMRTEVMRLPKEATRSTIPHKDSPAGVPNEVSAPTVILRPPRNKQADILKEQIDGLRQLFQSEPHIFFELELQPKFDKKAALSLINKYGELVGHQDLSNALRLTDYIYTVYYSRKIAAGLWDPEKDISSLQHLREIDYRLWLTANFGYQPIDAKTVTKLESERDEIVAKKEAAAKEKIKREQVKKEPGAKPSAMDMQQVTHDMLNEIRIHCDYEIENGKDRAKVDQYTRSIDVYERLASNLYKSVIEYFYLLDAGYKEQFTKYSLELVSIVHSLAIHIAYALEPGYRTREERVNMWAGIEAEEAPRQLLVLEDSAALLLNLITQGTHLEEKVREELLDRAVKLTNKFRQPEDFKKIDSPRKWPDKANFEWWREGNKVTNKIFDLHGKDGERYVLDMLNSEELSVQTLESGTSIVYECNNDEGTRRVAVEYNRLGRISSVKITHPDPNDEKSPKSTHYKVSRGRLKQVGSGDPGTIIPELSQDGLTARVDSLTLRLPLKVTNKSVAKAIKEDRNPLVAELPFLQIYDRTFPDISTMPLPHF